MNCMVTDQQYAFVKSFVRAWPGGSPVGRSLAADFVHTRHFKLGSRSLKCLTMVFENDKLHQNKNQGIFNTCTSIFLIRVNS